MVLIKYFHPAMHTNALTPLPHREQEANVGINEAQEQNDSCTQRHPVNRLDSFANVQCTSV